MASLIIRDLDDNVKRRLREQAAEHGRSMEQEARELIAAGVSDRARIVHGLGTWMHEQAAKVGYAELPAPDRSETTATVLFDE